MKRILCFVILACAVPAHGALIQFDVAGNDASGFGDPTPGLNNRSDAYVIDVICQEDLSSCELTFDVPNLPPSVNLPSVEVVQNDIMHQFGTLGFTSSDFQTQMRILGDGTLLPILNADNFDQAVAAIDWRFYDDAVWPNFTGYYGSTSTDISTPTVITIPEPTISSLLWAPLVLGLAAVRKARSLRKP